MDNKKRVALGVNSMFLVGLYIFTEYFCTKECFTFYEKPYLDPLLLGTFGLFFSISALNFFSEKIFSLWLRHIAWWVLPSMAFFVSSLPEYGGVMTSSDGRSEATVVLMVLLFIITLIYAPIMSHRLKKHVDA